MKSKLEVKASHPAWDKGKLCIAEDDDLDIWPQSRPQSSLRNRMR